MVRNNDAKFTMNAGLCMYTYMNLFNCYIFLIRITKMVPTIQECK